jgi:hypothetical protein
MAIPDGRLLRRLVDGLMRKDLRNPGSPEYNSQTPGGRYDQVRIPSVGWISPQLARASDGSYLVVRLGINSETKPPRIA